ncbi:MAG: hypothetical protein GOU97_01900 [Nanoarchaeota archaeon]|nr:hypothetical protein [Nanoarchaeota archaeon]
MRERKRYVIFEPLIKTKDFKNLFFKKLKELIGEMGSAEAHAVFINRNIIKVSNRHVPTVKTVLGLTESNVQIIRTTGTALKAKKILEMTKK